MTVHKPAVLSALLAAQLLAMPLAGFADGFGTPAMQPIRQEPYTYAGSATGTAYNANQYYNSAAATTPATTTYGNTSLPLKGRISTLPKGTAMVVKLDHPISSYGSHLGESIGATLENDVFVGGDLAIPAGSEVVGQIANVRSSGRLGRHGSLDVRFYSVKTPNGTVIPIQGHVITSDKTGQLKGNTFTVDLVKSVGVGAVGTGVGALAGTALGGLLGVAGTGAVLGTGVGALAGIGYAVARKGKDVVIPSGSRISIKVDEDVSLGY